MMKQILGKLPKKPSKSADACDGLSSNALASTRTSDSAGHEWERCAKPKCQSNFTFQFGSWI